MGDWIDDTRQSQEQVRAERERRERLLDDLGRVFIAEFRDEVVADVNKINQTFPQRYNRNTNGHLNFMEGNVGSLEVRVGQITVLEVFYMSGSHTLKVTRVYPTIGVGRNRTATEHYHLKLDRQDNIYLESKEGRHIPRETASQEILGYLVG
jgi:hypothetical protein